MTKKKFLKNGVNLSICYNKNKPKLFLIITFYACRWEGVLVIFFFLVFSNHQLMKYYNRHEYVKNYCH